jgi:hypothetical protein
MVASTREAILIGRTGGGAILPTTTIVVHSVEDLRPQAGSELMSQTAGLGLGQAKGEPEGQNDNQETEEEDVERGRRAWARSRPKRPGSTV